MTLTLAPPLSTNARSLMVLSATRSHRPHLTALLAACSPTALAARFLTGMAGPVPASMVEYLLMADRPGGAYLAFSGPEAIGHAMWAPVRPEHVGGRRAAEIALLVRDDHQGRGVGSALLEALAAGLRDARVPWIQATTSADNRVVTGLVARRAPGVRPTRDGADLTYLMPV